MAYHGIVNYVHNKYNTVNMARIIMSFTVLMLLGPLQHCHSNYLPLPSQPITFIGKKCHNNVKVHDVHARSVIPRGGDTASTDEATPEVITNTTDIEAISNRLKREEIQKVREAQKFLKMQQMRREKVSFLYYNYTAV